MPWDRPASSGESLSIAEIKVSPSAIFRALMFTSSNEIERENLPALEAVRWLIFWTQFHTISGDRVALKNVNSVTRGGCSQAVSIEEQLLVDSQHSP